MPPHSPKPGEIGGNGLGNGTVTEKLLGNLKPWIEGRRAAGGVQLSGAHGTDNPVGTAASPCNNRRSPGTRPVRCQNMNCQRALLNSQRAAASSESRLPSA